MILSNFHTAVNIIMTRAYVHYLAISIVLLALVLVVFSLLPCMWTTFIVLPHLTLNPPPL